MRFFPQSPLTKSIVQQPQGDPAVSTPDCKVQGFFPPEKGTPHQLGTQLAWGKDGAQHPCLPFGIVNKLHSTRLLVNFDKNILLPKCHKKAVLCASHHFSETFDSISKKENPRLAPFLLGADPTLRDFLLRACSAIRKISSAPCTLPLSSQLWHCWKGMPAWWQRGNTVVTIPGHAGQLRNS